MKRFLRRALVGLTWTMAVLVVLLVLFYAEEDWRGARDWAACQQELQAKGEILDLRQLVPPGKPEDDLSKVPIFAEAYAHPQPTLEETFRLIQKQINNEKDTRKRSRLGEIDIYLHDDSVAEQPKSFDLVSWQQYYLTIPEGHLTGKGNVPAQDVLQVLSRFDPQLHESESAVNNPNAYFPIDYERPMEPSLEPITGMIAVAKLLHLRGIAHLDNHEANLAEQDYLLSLRINRALAKNSLVINHLIMGGVQAVDKNILIEGLHQHAWNDDQLHEMESMLASSDMLEIAARTWRTERAASLQTFKLMQAKDPKLKKMMQPYGGWIWGLFQSRPAGWWDQDRLLSSLLMQKQIDAIDLKKGTLLKVQDDGASDKLSMVYAPVTKSTYSMAVGQGNVIARAETYRRLARLVCRLEEFRIAQGHYPEKLEELPDLPAHLNQEVLSEQPLRYQRKGDGYLLYSIGWNEKDDGGVIAKDPKEGDWVWPSP